MAGIGGGGKEDKASITDWLTDTKKVTIDALKNVPIKMGHTRYGRFEAEKKKKDIKWGYKKMTAEKKNDLMQKLAELDMKGANDNESAPPSPTPM